MASNKKKTMDKDLTIYPLNIDESKLNEIKKYPLCDVPHILLILGRVKAGKTSLLNSLYLSPRFYGDDFQVKILISPSAYNDPLNKYMVDNFDMIFTEYSDDLLEEILDMIKKDETENRYLIIFDDIVGMGVASKKSGKPDAITSLSTYYRHIGNSTQESKLSICITSQYFRYLTPILRNQSSGLYICGTFADKELAKIAEAYSYFGGSDREFINLYKSAKQKQHDFLFLNCHAMEAFRNHSDCLWTYAEFIKKFTSENKMMVGHHIEPEKLEYDEKEQDSEKENKDE